MSLPHVFVTVFFNLKDEANLVTYLQLACKETLMLDSDMIILADKVSMPWIKLNREERTEAPTQYIIITKEDLPYMKYEGKYKINASKCLIKPLWLSRPSLVLKAIQECEFSIDDNTIFTWYDFGIAKSRPLSFTQQLDPDLSERIIDNFGNRPKICCIDREISFFIKPKEKITFEEDDSYHTFVAGGFISGRKQHWQEIEDVYSEKVQSYLDKGMLPFDENLLSKKLTEDANFFDIVVVRSWGHLETDYHNTITSLTLVDRLESKGYYNLSYKCLDYLAEYLNPKVQPITKFEILKRLQACGTHINKKLTLDAQTKMIKFLMIPENALKYEEEIPKLAKLFNREMELPDLLVFCSNWYLEEAVESYPNTVIAGDFMPWNYRRLYPHLPFVSETKDIRKSNFPVKIRFDPLFLSLEPVKFKRILVTWGNIEELESGKRTLKISLPMIIYSSSKDIAVIKETRMQLTSSITQYLSSTQELNEEQVLELAKKSCLFKVDSNTVFEWRVFAF